MNNTGFVKNKRFARSAVLILSVLTLLSLAGCRKKGVSASDLPEPSESFYVSDYAGMLTGETETQLAALSAALDDATGAQIVVVTVRDLGGTAIDRYTAALFNYWGVGSAERNNGVMLLLSLNDDDYWVAQGSGLESTLDSATLKEVLMEKLEPDFAAGNYDSGVTAFVNDIYTRLCSYYNVSPSVQPYYGGAHGGSESREPTGEYGLMDMFTVLIIIAVIVILAVALARPMVGGYRRRRGYRPMTPPPPRGGFWRRMPPPRHMHGPGFGPGPRPGGAPHHSPGPRPGGGFSRPSGPRPSGPSRPSSFGGGGRHGGGGSTRGGGAGRR